MQASRAQFTPREELMLLTECLALGQMSRRPAHPHPTVPSSREGVASTRQADPEALQLESGATASMQPHAFGRRGLGAAFLCPPH